MEGGLGSAGLIPHDFVGCHFGSWFLTFVVPAPGGCNLDCSFCLVRQRREMSANYLSPDDLMLFIREAAEQAPIFAIAIQGHEPLLPESLPYTTAVLSTGRLMGIPTSLVTNGVLLNDAVDLLSTLMPTKMAVSLDADSPELHDRIRGVAGSWSAAIDGIRRAVKCLKKTALVVSSVLKPRGHQSLVGMPELLRQLAVRSWIVNPMIRVGADSPGGPVGNRDELFRELLILRAAAERARIRLTIMDELDRLQHGIACVRQPELRSLHVRTLPPGVEIFRLAPNGQCSDGLNILKQMKPDVPRWQPSASHAGEFLEMVSGRSYTLPRMQQSDIHAWGAS
jgi:MoaA/NifB/PqqE/SkfB family radical SAM enzyme